MSDHYAFPALFMVLGALLAVGVHAAARSRGNGGDVGDVWAYVLRVWGAAVAVLSLVSCGIAPMWESFWRTGIHLQIDRVFPGAIYYRGALFAPLVLWALVLLWSAAREPASPVEARWIAGGIGFSPSRAWILLAAAPIALVLLGTMRSLGGGEYAYPGALWGALATIVITLVGLAASRGALPSTVGADARRGAELQPSAGLTPWPEALKEQGVNVEPLLPLGENGSLSVLRGRLDRSRGEAGAIRPLGPEGREVLECLLQSRQQAPPTDASSERSCLLVAPDDMGQIELLAELADTLLGQARELTLIVVPSDPEALLMRVKRWIAPGTRANIMHPSRSLGGSDISIVDAETLSDSILPRLGGEPSLGRIGLVVWWDAHAYTGVLAANMWAVSRRLDRLIRAMGREDIRTLAVIRSTPDPGAQLGRYVRRLFPNEFREISASGGAARDVAPYRIVSHSGFFDGHREVDVPQALWHPGLITGLASMRAGYRSYIDAPPGITRSEQDSFAKLDVSGVPAGGRLAAASSVAAASIRHVRASDVLAFSEMVRGAGRAGPEGALAYVGAVLPSNPYARYVLSSHFPAAGRGASRRFVCAESRPRIVERHLLLALSEMEDSRANLRTTSLWNEDVVRKTLDRLDREHSLRSFETRWLGKDGRLQIDRVYKSLKSLPEHVRPLDTAGTQPVLVRDASGKDGGIRRMVDKERLPIVAYPQCVFMSGGTRYEVRDWDSLDEAVARGWVECHVQDKHRITWRKRDVQIVRMDLTKASVRAAQSAQALSRQPADVTYEEIVRGAHMFVFENGAQKEHRVSFQKPIRTRFDTQALLLELPVPPNLAALASVAQALRHVLPVHLGVEEDAIEVVPIAEGPRARVAIVDLFPDGIGVVPAILDDDDFLLMVLGHAHDWLEACTCRDPLGCPECLRSLEASAANPDNAHRRDAALGVLSKMVTRRAAHGPR